MDVAWPNIDPYGHLENESIDTRSLSPYLSNFNFQTKEITILKKRRQHVKWLK